ncbi:porin family protein [Methylocystis sp. L43]|jgi:outer membrane immunogenic protein|uniref:outer membrane protein n=1 Tax=unclassified Methylocystis TaxID=2625913 RepID=UPI0018C30B5C|nr:MULTISPECIES: outer membrane beta-barrel protein [unclassified Methylocystis]MBG0799272.1 porin family protein [Methylocystis sp. L43]MBG0807054.1 porin family protein [Methylocystis sp. H15]
MTKLPVAAGLALALTAGSALAADLPHYKGPPPFMPPPFTWTGIYGGVNIGGAFGNQDNQWTRENIHSALGAPIFGGVGWNRKSNLSGVIGGGQIGYNYQFNPWFVVGVETDFQGAGIQNTTNGWGPGVTTPGIAIPGVLSSAYAGAGTVNSRVNWWGTVRGRVGVTPFMPNLMFYATGGFAYGQSSSNFNYGSTRGISGAIPFGPFAIPYNITSGAFGSASFDNVKTGWTVGGGFEYAPLMFPNWSFKLEYDYVDLGRTTLTTLGLGTTTFAIGPFAASAPFFNSATTSVQTRFHVARVGLNYRLNWFSAPSAPVLAKY